jgi:hypothetical protein
VEVSSWPHHRDKKVETKDDKENRKRRQKKKREIPREGQRQETGELTLSEVKVALDRQRLQFMARTF